MNNGGLLMDKYDYVIVKPEMEEVLYHAGFHKYIDKYLGKNGKWIYKYAGQAKNAATGAINKAKTMLPGFQKQATGAVTTAKKKASSLASTGTKTARSVKKQAQSKINKMLPILSKKYNTAKKSASGTANKLKKQAKGAYYSGKSKVSSTVTKARRYKNKYQHVITDNNGRTLSIASLDNENFGMNPSSRKGQRGSRTVQGISAGRKRAKKQIRSAKIGAKTKGYSRKGNVTSRGYSGSQGSGESKRQRNLGTRYSKNMRLSAEYLRERAYNSKKNRL